MERENYSRANREVYMIVWLVTSSSPSQVCSKEENVVGRVFLANQVQGELRVTYISCLL